MKATIIMNCIHEDFGYLRSAIKSYVNQEGVEVQLIVSTIEDDPCIGFIRINFPSVELCIYPKSEHPGKCPQGSFLQINKALPMMTGEWFAFASSNDIAKPDKIKQEIEKCLSTEKKICYSSYETINESGAVTLLQKFHDYNYIKHLSGNFVSDCALIHKSIVDKYLPFKTEYNNYAYWDLWLRVHEGEGDVFCYNEKPTWEYRILNSSMHIARRKDPALIASHKKDRERMLADHKFEI